MSRKIDRRLSLLAVLAVVLGLGLLVHPGFLLSAAPIVFGIVEGDGGDDDGGGNDDDAGDAGDGGDDGDDDADGDDAGGEGDGDDDGAEGAAGAAGARPGAKKPKGRQQDMIPAYRLAELRERFESQLAAESGKTRALMQRMARMLTGEEDGDGRAPLTPKQKQLRTEFMQLFPEFAGLLKIAEKSDAILGLADNEPVWRQETHQYWDRVAKVTTTRLNAHAAKALGVAKLDADTQSVVRDSFIAWVKADKTGERNHRYEGQDESLIGDFWTFFAGRFGRPQQRAVNAATMRSAARPMPRGGNASTHMGRGTKPRKPKPDEDPFEAANDRAWGALQDQIAAGE